MQVMNDHGVSGLSLSSSSLEDFQGKQGTNAGSARSDCRSDTFLTERRRQFLSASRHVSVSHSYLAHFFVPPLGLGKNQILIFGLFWLEKSENQRKIRIKIN